MLLVTRLFYTITEVISIWVDRTGNKVHWQQRVMWYHTTTSGDLASKV